MKKIWIALIILVFAIITFLTGPVIWPPISDPMPTPSQIPFFIFLSAIESLLFGFGIAFIFIAWPHLKRVRSEAKTRTILAFISLVWLLISWWPHGNLHMHVGLDFSGLLAIDYGFHLTIMLATLLLVNYFIKEIKTR